MEVNISMVIDEIVQKSEEKNMFFVFIHKFNEKIGFIRLFISSVC